MIHLVLFLCLCAVAVDDTEILILKLNSGEFHEREKAQKELSARMDFDLYMRFQDYKAPNVETHMRVELLCKNWEQQQKEFYAPTVQGYPKYPWISDKIPFYNDYVDRALRLGIDTRSPNWESWRMATQIYFAGETHELFTKCMQRCQRDYQYERAMKQGRILMEEQIQRFIQEEDEYWRRNKEENPLRVKK